MFMNAEMILKLVSFLSLLSLKAVKGEFILTVNFINYSNPTGLCAECSMTRLENVTSADQLVPVCCDEPPFNRTQDCDNTGEERCDTSFRWIIRPFGASLKTRPVDVPNAQFSLYFSTPCPQSSSTICPFSEISTTFGQGDTSFLGVAANPLPVTSRSITTWTGKIQFFIEAVDSMLPNIIDSLLVNLDNLELGQPEFTEEITYSGFHNISHMTMSFKVECALGFCGSDCTITSQNNPLVSECHSDGTVVCIGSGRDPLTNCTDCLPNRNISTNCTTCLTRFNGESCSEDNLDQSPGPVTGPVSVTGSVTGPVTGPVSVTGSVTGPVTGAGSVTGSVTGPVTGPGSVTGPVTGAVAGAVVGVLVLAVIVAVIIVVATMFFYHHQRSIKTLAEPNELTYDYVAPADIVGGQQKIVMTGNDAYSTIKSDHTESIEMTTNAVYNMAH